MYPVPHPAKGELAVRRITNRRLAADYGCSETFVCRVLNGWQPPPARFRALVAETVNLPESELFHDSEVMA